MPHITLPADLHFEGDDGLNLARLSGATDPSAVFAGSVLRAGSEQEWSWAEVVEVDDEGWVHFRKLSKGPITITRRTTEQLNAEQAAWFAQHPGFGPNNWVDAFRDATGELLETDEFFDAAALFAPRRREIPTERLERGCVYRLEARRQNYGVWNGSALLGLQIEMGWPTVSHESPWDRGGSARPTELVGRVPADIELVAGWTACEVCGGRTNFNIERREHEHTKSADHEPVVKRHTPNRALRIWLIDFEQSQRR